MNLLHANDRRGEYPPSWYAATVEPLARFAPLKGAARADVCVVGGGYSGLSAALHLAQAGLDVVLLEAQRVGFGASGRNGGQLGSGQRVEQTALERLVGEGDAAHLWRLAEEAKDLVKSLVARHGIDCHLEPGVAHACFSARETAAEHAYADHLAARYGYEQIEKLDAAGFAALCPSPAYRGGTLDMGAAHLHPLAYALGLAGAAEAAGVRIFEGAEVRDIRRGPRLRVATDAGHVDADHLILACNGYLGGLDRRVAARVMPINNFIVATAPLGAVARRVLTRDVAVADTKFVVNYFRLSHDGRLLFGGGESYWLPLSARHTRHGGAADAEDLSASGGGADRLCLGRDAGHHHAADAVSGAACAEHPVGLGLFRAWRRHGDAGGSAHGRGGARAGGGV